MESMIFITGATGGLGKALAAECASRGWDLFLTDLRPDKLEILAEGLRRSYGIRALWEEADLTQDASRKVLLESLREKDLRFLGLINVAGTDHEGLFLEKSAEEIIAILRLNVEATLVVTHALVALRDPAATFRIINVSSLAAFFSMPVKATYAASKSFILYFSLALRNELRDQNVSVSALCPAGLPTNEGCIAAIESQGIMGQLTTEDIGKVAHETIEGALRGKAIIIPGFLNRVIRSVGGLIPPTSIAELVGSRWRMAQQRRAEG